MGGSDTFELVWTRAGLTDGAEPRRTLAPPPAGTGGRATLPHLTLGDPEVGDDPTADLRLTEVLGQGGMGVVWLAHQASLDRQVAIKRARPERGPGAARSLLREARVLGSLEHPNILPIHALGLDDDGLPVLVMKRVEGVAWSALLGRPDHPGWSGEGGDPLDRHLRILAAVCRAVEFAHDRGVLHRDLKPDNVMIGRFGEVYLMDWGVARQVDGSPRRHVVGTPAYMAPELLDLERPVDVRTDVFLLGACLVEVLTGRPLHDGATLAEVMRRVHDCAPPELPPATPPTLAAIARRACAADPAERFPTVADLRQALESHERHAQAARLAAEGAARAAELAELPAGSPAAEGLFAEARFAFRQALAGWPGHPTAADGLRALLAREVPARAARGDLEGAAGWIAELRALGGDVAALEVGLERARLDRASLEALRRESDPNPTAGIRALALGALVVLFALVGVVVLPRPEVYDQRVAFWVVTGSYAAAAVAAALGWRRFAVNAVGARLLAVLGGLAFAQITHRGLAWRFDVPLPAMLGVDLVLYATASGASALWLGPRMALAAVPALAGLVLVVAVPDQALTSFALAGGLSGAVAAAVVAFEWSRTRAR